MAMNRFAYQRDCRNPKCRVRSYDAGSASINEVKPLPCPACGKVGK